MKICRDLPPFWNSSSKNSSSLKKYTSNFLEKFLWYSSSWNSSIIKNFQNFPMVLEFHELEYHEKLDFAKLKYPKDDKSLHIFETVVYYNIVCKQCYLAIVALFTDFHFIGEGVLDQPSLNILLLLLFFFLFFLFSLFEKQLKWLIKSLFGIL